jgi:hypothetical protein
MPEATGHLYVYYRVPESRMRELRPRIVALQAELARRTGVQGRLLHRCDDPALWMEVYEHVPEPQGFRSMLAALVREQGVDALLAPGATRVTECFVG